MKKFISKIMVLVLCFACLATVFVLTSCGASSIINLHDEEDYTAENAEGAYALLEQFLEPTISGDVNVVITTKIAGKAARVETIVGDRSYSLDSEGGKIYAFKKDGKYYIAVDGGDTKYYMESEESYKNTYMVSLLSITSLNSLTDEDGKFSCTLHIDNVHSIVKKNKISKSNATISYTFKTDEGSVQIQGTSTNGQIKNITITSPNGQSIIQFDYSKATIAIPDLTTWEQYQADSQE